MITAAELYDRYYQSSMPLTPIIVSQTEYDAIIEFLDDDANRQVWDEETEQWVTLPVYTWNDHRILFGREVIVK